MFSSLWNFLTLPTLPRTSLAIMPTHLALLEMQKRGGNFHPKKLGVQPLPEGLVRVSLTEPNITRESEFLTLLSATAEKAGFSRKLKLSVTLPEGSAHSQIVTLEHKPASRAELEQMLAWKIGRTTNLKAADLRLSFTPLSQQSGQPRWLVAGVHQQVLDQYERLFSQLGWQAGLILPQHLGEAQWLLRGGAAADEDQALVSVNEQGFVVVLVRGTEPLLIREVTCTPQEREDEFFRLLVFYRDRMNPTHPLKRVLVIGETNEQGIFSNALTAALEQSPQKLSPLTLGLNLDAAAPFHRLAAAAGIATMSY
jgi:Tfp pilus assembly PilM family ATPase